MKRKEYYKQLKLATILSTNMLMDKEKHYSRNVTFLKTIFHILLITTVFFIPCNLKAQNETMTGKRSAVTLGYFGETITNPGLFFGYEYNLRPQKLYQLHLSANAGGYHHSHNHTGLFSEIQIGQRYTFGSGLFVEQLLGVGYLHTFLSGGKIYEVSEPGAISEARNSGRGHFMPSLSLGFGLNLAQKDKAPLLLFLRPKAFLQYPYNGYALSHAAVLIGITKPIF